MQILEFSFCLFGIAAALACTLLTSLAPGKHKLSIISMVLTVAIILFLILVLLERISWRIYPAIAALVVILALIVIERRRTDPSSSPLRRILAVACTILSVLSMAAVIVFPLRNLQKPSGKYPVGTACFVVVDQGRTGIYLDEPGVPRRLMAQAWYPAAPRANDYPRARWIPDQGVAKAYAQYASLPAFIMSHVRLIKANGRIGAPAAVDTGTMPVVVISHGWTGARAMHTDLAEELASRGIVAIAIDHPYGALSVGFPDGQVVPLFAGALPQRKDGDAAFDMAASRLVATYADDIAAVVDHVRTNDTINELKGRLNPDRIALIGHSTGGGAAALAAINDSRLAGIVGLDAWLEPLGQRVDLGLQAAQLHIGSASWKGGPNAVILERFRKASGQWDGFRIEDSGHADFAMIRHITSAGSIMGLAGTLNGFRFADSVTPIVCNWIQAILLYGPKEARNSVSQPSPALPAYRE
ncbi:MAG: dienelactone hydrolase family protein [Spirochaetia bacterium]|jgi:pimeloyl-ACP methyl ester carboxylesterase|nr:dienelactone hydrolase family protein [Spirochaetia bacterium]